jgi:hypothetical protein
MFESRGWHRCIQFSKYGEKYCWWRRVSYCLFGCRS